MDTSPAANQSPNSDPAFSSAQRGAAWILQHLAEDGSLRGATDLRAYYKTPAALLWSGHPRQAHLLLHRVRTKMLLPDGDLKADGVPWLPIYRTYPHAWLCLGATAAGHFELARPLARFVETFHDPVSGGFWADEARTTQEIMTTAMAGLATLYAGNLTLALRTGDWFANLMAAQPGLGQGLYTSWRNGALVTTFSPEEAAGCLIDPAKPRQYYFQYGISAAFLAQLSAFTGEAKWLRLARQFLHAIHFAGPDRFSTPQTGKVGWGAAWAYRLSQDPADRELIQATVAGLGSLQNGDGSWSATGLYGTTATADSVTLDVTSEFVALLSAISSVPGAE